MREIIIAIVTSLLASIIFWFIFNFFPEKKRYNKVRPKVEYDIYEIFIALHSFIDISLEINEFGRRFPRTKIDSGEVTKDDFELWLQNKCLNASFQFDEMGKYLLPVGDKLESCSKEITKMIEHAATYYSFMTANEILLIQKIETKVNIYGYTYSAVDNIGNMTFRPMVPNISYMAENFFDLSVLYYELKQIVWSYKRIDRSINKYFVPNFVYQQANREYIRGNFSKCIRLVRRMKNEPEVMKQGLLFKAYYMLGKKAKAEDSLRQYLRISKENSSFLQSLMRDEHMNFYSLEEWVFAVISEFISDADICYAIESDVQEKKIQKEGLDTVNKIKSFYAEKIEKEDKKSAERFAKHKESLLKRLGELSQEDACIE